MPKRQALNTKIREMIPELWRFVEHDLKGDVYSAEPIRLSHVLRALDATPMIDESCFEINTTGFMVFFSADRTPSTSTATWDLTKDTLDEQSDEVIYFLHDIICKE